MDISQLNEMINSPEFKKRVKREIEKWITERVEKITDLQRFIPSGFNELETLVFQHSGLEAWDLREEKKWTETRFILFIELSIKLFNEETFYEYDNPFEHSVLAIEGKHSVYYIREMFGQGSAYNMWIPTEEAVKSIENQIIPIETLIHSIDEYAKQLRNIE